MTAVTGRTLIAWGYTPGTWFKDAITAAETIRAKGGDETAQRAAVAALAPENRPVMALRGEGALAHRMNIEAEGDDPDEGANIAAVDRHMRELMRLPTVAAGAVMPDACSAGAQPGTIPVGGVIAARNAIHPGMHSADICCSMAISVFKDDIAPKLLLDAGMQLGHFGGGGRPQGKQIRPPDAILTAFADNGFLKTLVPDAIAHHATIGDGNHFFFVGRLASTGQIALVTHHGSRRPGAMLYKAGMAAAERMTRELSPATPQRNAWIVADSPEGKSYWEALQVVRAWTRSNHYATHDLVIATLGLTVVDRFWNEHNFVFQRSDGLFYHAKGATPAFPDWAADATELTLIPMNMAEPILIARGSNADNGLGFAPHGAGRNFSRSAYMRRHADKTEVQMVAEQTAGIDARFFCGIPDVSELPAAYKPAAAVRRQIARFGLAEIVDEIRPLGSIMAGDWQRNAPWRNKKRNAAAPAPRQR